MEKTGGKAYPHGIVQIMYPPLPLAGEGTGEGRTRCVSPSPQSSPPVKGEEVFGGIFYLTKEIDH